MRKPKVSLYISAMTDGAMIRVPCFNYSEGAMVEYYLRNKRGAESVFFETRRTGSTTPSIIKDAAEFTYGDRPRMFRSMVSGKSAQYLITATARRITTPLHRKKTNEIIKEQIRNES